MFLKNNRPIKNLNRALSRMDQVIVGVNEFFEEPNTSFAI